MKVAYIVQCHKNAEQINRLIRRLVSEDAHVYVHIDSKNYAIAEHIEKGQYVTILPAAECVDVRWGGVTQIKATLKLLEAVWDSKIQYDYIWLISGQCYPVKSAAQIDAYLAEQNGAAFIHVAQNHLLDFDKRNSIYYPAFMIGKGMFARVLRNIWVRLSGGRQKTFGIFRRKGPIDHFYYGSSWWCLPYNCVVQMWRILQERPEILKFFEHSVCSDECFFQTLVMLTAFKSNVRGNLVYIDWSNLQSSPRTLLAEDLDSIVASGMPFARKLDMDVDRALFELIDARVAVP